jgi:uncharacterized protein (DUF952 family)
MKKFIYKICLNSEWVDAQKNNIFNGSKKDIIDGYIHFSNKDQVESTLNKYFININNLILLKVETSKLKKLVWEKSSGGLFFPHLYSLLNIKYVTNSYKIKLDKDGSHILPPNF